MNQTANVKYAQQFKTIYFFFFYNENDIQCAKLAGAVFFNSVMKSRNSRTGESKKQ